MSSLRILTDVIHDLEDPKIPFLNFIATFIGAITLRNFLEQFSTKNPVSLVHDVHYYIFYLALALSLIILFHLGTRESIDKISRVVLPSFIILCIVPLLDLLLSLGQGYNITYLRPGVHHHLLQGFLLLGQPFEGNGVSPGQRIEIMLVIVMSYIYFFIKTHKPLRSFLFSTLVYAAIFFYLSLPFSLKIFLTLMGLPYNDSNETMIHFYLLLILPLSQLIFYFYNKQYFTSVWKDSRPLRIIYFLLMVALGFVFFLNPAVRVLFLNNAVRQSGIILSWILIPPAIIFGWLFSVMVNNSEDLEIDRISNKERPTVTNTIPINDYKNISLVFLGMALIYAMAVNFLCLFIIILWIGNYFLYSAPPFRLKRVPFFSKMMISLNSLLLFGLGYSLCAGDDMPPAGIIVYFLVCLTAAINFIDIKDHAGDKEAGIMTLPVILGLKTGKITIGIFFIVTYALTSLMVGDIRLLPILTMIGSFIYWLINRKNYSEKPVLITCLLSIVLMIVYFWMRSY